MELPLTRQQAAAALAVIVVATVGLTGWVVHRRWQSSPPPPLPPARTESSGGTASAPPARTVPPPELPAPPQAVAPSPAPASAPQVVVHVAGRVRQPGVYALAQGARVIDAVKRAGGAQPDADMDAINLAARAQDGSQIYLPRKQAAPAAAAHGRPADAPAPPGRVPLAGSRPAAARPASEAAAGRNGRGEGERPEKITSPSQGRVNLNRADAQELQKLPFIGPAMAQRIIQYRQEHGAFQSVDQLLEVPGIGEKRLEKLRDLVQL